MEALDGKVGDLETKRADAYARLDQQGTNTTGLLDTLRTETTNLSSALRRNDARGRLGLQDRSYPQSARLQALLIAALSVDSAQISAQAMEQGLCGIDIGKRIEHARVKAISQHSVLRAD